ncbi:ferrochelatase [Wenyingzhuangia marina]|uniref:Ferrochelatase n=1 Tax=Wenyingzhuangia marina TaxID=1195760 RepID=A0A1M5U7L6_9FLAO|nr:ferrochelatase [Wenyingzhuangia marina]GGF69192.1 ferrochelatase [Wenyingzhuangia marina]SHH58891.1 ferrochelatase [Wenyingzhuangia marina]
MKGILLVNLGSPNSTSVKDVRNYLDEFLMDERVIDVPFLTRCLLVKGIILNTRPKQSAEAYSKVWTNEGSPLIVISEKFTNKVKEHVKAPVALAMRYGKPSIETGITELANQGVTDILLVPLYPQFAMATTETIVVLAERIIRDKFPKIKLSSFPAFYNKQDYIDVLSKSIQETLEKEEYDHLLFSYHGVPERHIKNSDITGNHCSLNGECCNTKSEAHEFCYRHQCYATTQGVVEKLNLKPGFYSTSFQSRLGKDPWLQPYTDVTINDRAQNGIKKLAVVTPAFVADCLETIEEIGMEAKHEFEENTGEKFTTIPCLNDREDWVAVVSNWLNEWLNK